MKNCPVVSVVMPVYNTVEYLREAIDSILNQSFRDFEFIIIDDASIDGSLEILESYKDDRIVLIKNIVNKGIVCSLNSGFAIAKGEFIARMDSDDISALNRFEEQINFLRNNPNVVVCGTNLKIIGSEEEIFYFETHGEIEIAMLCTNPIAHPTVFIRKSALTLNNELCYTFDNDKIFVEDYALWTRLVFQGEFYNIQKPLLFYRVHRTQISNRKANAQADKFKIIRREYVIAYCINRLMQNDLGFFHKTYLIAENVEYLGIRAVIKKNRIGISENVIDLLTAEYKRINLMILSKSKSSFILFFKLIMENPLILFNVNLFLTLRFFCKSILNTAMFWKKCV